VISVLYVAANGAYFGTPGVDPWDAARDARFYAGPGPVVAHPPCARWGRYFFGGPSARVRRLLGDDGGCFAAALWAVRTFGGVLEHPEASSAWAWFGLQAPMRNGGWRRADSFGGWTCCVEQGHYGHRARKATWLYAVGTELPDLEWGPSGAIIGDGETHDTDEARRRATKTGACQRMSKRERLATPPAFRDALLAIANTAPGCDRAGNGEGEG